MKDNNPPDAECWGSAPELKESLGVSEESEFRARMSKLTETIEQEIIPRLMLAFGDSAGPEGQSASIANIDVNAVPMLSNQHVNELVSLLMKHDISVSIEYLNALRRQGVRLRDMYLDLLAPAARRFGVMWEDDYCTFTDVTIGVTRMHQILHIFSPSFCAHAPASEAIGKNALIVPVPGEQHVFGQLMVIEFFRRAGWHVWSGAPNTLVDVEDVVAKHDFDIIGISVGADRHLDDLSNLVTNLRGLSDTSRILLGGRCVINTNGRIADESGSDGFARDGKEAVAVAHELLQDK